MTPNYIMLVIHYQSLPTLLPELLSPLLVLQQLLGTHCWLGALQGFLEVLHCQRDILQLLYITHSLPLNFSTPTFLHPPLFFPFLLIGMNAASLQKLLMSAPENPSVLFTNDSMSTSSASVSLFKQILNSYLRPISVGRGMSSLTLSYIFSSPVFS